MSVQTTPLPVAGYWHHASAVGELVASLYRLGGATETDPADSSPGIADVALVIDRLETKGLNRVVSVDIAARTAFVESRCPVWRLAEVCLSRGLVPACVPAPATLTTGGALVRTSVGSDSIRSGTFAESVESVDLLVSSGEIVAAKRHGPNRQLFEATLGGRGATGFVVGATVRLVPTTGFVATRCVGAGSARELAAVLAEVAQSGAGDGEAVDFAEALVHDRAPLVIGLGRKADDAEAAFLSAAPSRVRGVRPPYAATLVPGARDLLSTADYLRRWDADEFWHSYDYGIDRRWVGTLWPPALRKPEAFARLDAARESPLVRWAESLARWRPGAARVYREIAVPLDGLADLVDGLWRIAPGVSAWVVPVARMPRADGGAAARPGESTELGAVCGIWGPGAHLRHGHNLAAEAALDRLAAELGGFTIRSGR